MIKIISDNEQTGLVTKMTIYAVTNGKRMELETGEIVNGQLEENESSQIAIGYETLNGEPSIYINDMELGPEMIKVLVDFLNNIPSGM